MRIPLVVVHRGSVLHKRAPRKHRKLRGSPPAYLKWLDDQGARVGEKIHRFFKHEAVRLATILPASLGLSKATKADGGRIVEDLDLSGWESIQQILEPELGAAYLENAEQGLAVVGVKATKDILGLVHPEAVAWAKKHAAELIGKKVNPDGSLVTNPRPKFSIPNTTREELRDLVWMAIDDGWSAQELSQQIEDGWSFSRGRADTIARTELASAHIQGNLEGWRQSGVVETKQWIIGSEHDMDDECDDNADDGPISLDDTFSSGDDGPPAHPNCVCDLLPGTDSS